MSVCNLCPRNCSVDRDKNNGFCGVDNSIKIAKAALHFWEEPCISGVNGSGTIFFSGCSLGCVFCQNHELSDRKFGKTVSDSRFYEILFELKQKGAHNINLVTADHYLHKIIPIIRKAKENGLEIPVALNTSSYIKPELIKQCEDVIDIYIADFKFYNSSVAEKYALAPDYPDVAKRSIHQMFASLSVPVYKDGIMQKGVIVRVLLLPENTIDAKLSVKYLLDKYGNDICLSIMCQYTPVVSSEFSELERTVTQREYKSLVDFAIAHGFSHGYIQQFGCENDSYIPHFDLEGV